MKTCTKKMKNNLLDVKIKKVNYEKDSTNILSNIKLSLNKGDVLNVIGNTGIGKSTFLKCVSGIIPNVQPSFFEGEIHHKGKLIEFEEYRTFVSISFQETESQFIFDTAKNEILMGLNEKERKKAKKLISLFKIENILSKSLRSLSCGQKKVISLISVLSTERDIIILDEPTANLDLLKKKILLKIISKLKKEKVIIIASHDSDVQKISNMFLIYNERKKSWEYFENKQKYSERKEDKLNLKLKRIPFKIDYKNELLRFHNVSYTYPDHSYNLDQINISIYKGEIVGIIGENGSGKTTLINLITGKINPKKGHISKNYKRYSLILQEPEKQLFSHSILEELKFGLKKPEEYNKEIKEILNIIGLDKLKDAHPFFISRGQKQLLLISAILIRKPELIMIDEPFTGIDNKMVKKIINLILYYYKLYQPTIILLDQEESSLRKIISKKLVFLGGKLVEHQLNLNKDNINLDPK